MIGLNGKNGEWGNPQSHVGAGHHFSVAAMGRKKKQEDVLYPVCHRCRKPRKGRWVKVRGEETWECLWCGGIRGKRRVQEDIDLAPMTNRRWK